MAGLKIDTLRSWHTSKWQASYRITYDIMFAFSTVFNMLMSADRALMLMWLERHLWVNCSTLRRKLHYMWKWHNNSILGLGLGHMSTLFGWPLFTFIHRSVTILQELLVSWNTVSSLWINLLKRSWYATSHRQYTERNVERAIVTLFCDEWLSPAAWPQPCKEKNFEYPILSPYSLKEMIV